MVDLNWAYAVLREPSLRASYDSSHVAITVDAAPSEGGNTPAAPERSATLSERMSHASEAVERRDLGEAANVTLDFGRFAGMTLRQIARVEPGYLEWLRRHSSGLRYRHQIDAVLESAASSRVSAGDEP